MMKVIVFKSNNRFDSFVDELKLRDVEIIVLDFDDSEWVGFDYSDIELVIYYPNFEFSSNYHLSLYKVHDNLKYLADRYPDLNIYPDPRLIDYYSDKYKQYLFLSSNKLPYPETMPVFSSENINTITSKIGFPLIIKNRYGAGGDYVYKINNTKMLLKYFNLSAFNFVNISSLSYYLFFILRKEYFYWLVKRRKMQYPFLSFPLLAQKFIPHNKDLKVVLCGENVIEAHWRRKSDIDMWKMNIDGGGIGEWSYVPDEAIKLCVKLARMLGSKWLNVDLIEYNNEFLISEFSPVWHHYRYNEKDNFIYKKDYNIDIPLTESLNLEKIIIDSYLDIPNIR